jgi:SAM-dependent methyltransferase
MSDARIFGPGESSAAFRRIGLGSVRLLLRHVGLQPTDRILDVGSGIGRVALPLTHYLSESGSYAGLEPVSSAVQWCTSNITPTNPNFTFDHVDLHNAMYNPEGTVDPLTFRFPYEAASFDVVFLFSVFTHMQPDAVDHYLAEIQRVLVPGGRLLASVFVMDIDGRQRVKAGKAHRPFKKAERIRPGSQSFWTDNLDLPESAIAYPPARPRNLITSKGLSWELTDQRGGWRESKPGQDVITMRKPR